MYFKHQKIYVAYLPFGKKYIGRTNNFQRRFREHFSHKGSKITRKYKPRYIKIIGNCFNERNCKFKEHRITNKMIDKYGYDHVRGGGHTNSNSF